MKWKIYNEVSGWKLEDKDLTLVNSESDGDKLYIVKLWWGSGYMTDNYNAYAFAPDEALNYVVAYIEKNDPETLAAVDENAMEDQDDPYFDETYEYVDATMEGASDTHYVYRENLTIAEYPKDHDYPMSKGIKRESRRRRTRRVNESGKKIMLTWDEYNKLCDFIDMDWKRWNKSSSKNIDIVADRALEHLGWITSKDFTGQSPKDVEISFTIPSALPDDEFSTGTQKSMTIYDLIDGMFWNESTGKGKFGKKFNESPYYDDDDEFGPTNGRERRTCSYCGNTVYGDSEGEYVCPYCGYDSEL